jgi:predicted extracellular nuclease
MAGNMRDLAIATVNLLNLTVPGGRTYDEDKPAIPDTEEGRLFYDRRIDWLARAIERLDADVICFQELWTVQALNDVFAKVTGVGAYDLVARDAPGIGKPQVAMAVRKDRDGNSKVQSATWIDAFPDTFRLQGVRERDGAAEEISVSIDRFSRPVLRVVVQPEGRSPTPPAVTFYGCHLKSKGGTRLAEVKRGTDTVLDHHYALASSAVSHTRRVLEAAALRALLDGAMASIADADLSPTVVLGDLNDGTLSVSTELITGQPSYRVFAKSSTGATADKGLYTVETLQQYRSQTNVYYTYVYRNKLESLDHVLVSEEFYDHSSKRQWSFRELEIYNDHLNTSDKSRIDQVGSTDHGIVRAYFDWNPMAAELAKLEPDDLPQPTS